MSSYIWFAWISSINQICLAISLWLPRAPSGKNEWSAKTQRSLADLSLTPEKCFRDFLECVIIASFFFLFLWMEFILPHLTLSGFHGSLRFVQEASTERERKKLHIIKITIGFYVIANFMLLLSFGGLSRLSLFRFFIFRSWKGFPILRLKTWIIRNSLSYDGVLTTFFLPWPRALLWVWKRATRLLRHVEAFS